MLGLVKETGETAVEAIGDRKRGERIKPADAAVVRAFVWMKTLAAGFMWSDIVYYGGSQSYSCLSRQLPNPSSPSKELLHPIHLLSRISRLLLGLGEAAVQAPPFLLLVLVRRASRRGNETDSGSAVDLSMWDS